MAKVTHQRFVVGTPATFTQNVWGMPPAIALAPAAPPFIIVTMPIVVIHLEFFSKPVPLPSIVVMADSQEISALQVDQSEEHSPQVGDMRHSTARSGQ